MSERRDMLHRMALELVERRKVLAEEWKALGKPFPPSNIKEQAEVVAFFKRREREMKAGPR